MKATFGQNGIPYLIPQNLIPSKFNTIKVTSENLSQKLATKTA